MRSHYPHLVSFNPSHFSTCFVGATPPHIEQAVHVKTLTAQKGTSSNLPRQVHDAQYPDSFLHSCRVSFQHCGWTCPTRQSLHIILEDIQLFISHQAHSKLLNSVHSDSFKSRRRPSIIMILFSLDDSLLKMDFHVRDVTSFFLRRLPHLRCFPQHLAHSFFQFFLPSTPPLY